MTQPGGGTSKEAVEESRAQAIKQWTRTPIGLVAGDPVTVADFDRVAASRYAVQNWMHDLIPFGAFDGKQVLEIGVGNGSDGVEFARRGAIYHGVDITQAHLDLAARNFRVRGLRGEFARQDACALAYPDASFDAVYSFGVLHHIADYPRAFREIHRVLKPGGRAIIGLYNKISVNHLMLVAWGAASGRLRDLGYDGLLATIEQGADGRKIKPFVRLFSRRDFRRQLRPFRHWTIHTRQLTPNQFRVGPVIRLWPHLPAPLRRTFDHNFGWYLVALAEK